MIDFKTITDPPLPSPLSWHEFERRARAEGIWGAVLEAGVAAGMVGAEDALQDIELPQWAQQVVRAQFPARIE